MVTRLPSVPGSGIAARAGLRHLQVRHVCSLLAVGIRRPITIVARHGSTPLRVGVPVEQAGEGLQRWGLIATRRWVAARPQPELRCRASGYDRRMALARSSRSLLPFRLVGRNFSVSTVEGVPTGGSEY